MQDRVDHTVAIGIGLQQYGRCGVAEERTSGTVGIVYDRRHLVGAHDDDPLARAGLDELGSRRQREQESAARSRNIERESILATGLVCDQVTRRGEEHIGGHGGADHHVDRHRVDARFVEQVDDGTRSHVGTADAFAFEDVARFDTGVRHDPLIVGVDHLAQLIVGEDILRKVLSHSRYRCCNLTH